MVSLSSSARALASLLIVAFFALSASPAHAGPATTDTDQLRLQLLPPIQDPDDDDDGVSDEHDPEPTNPAVAPTAEPDIISPVQDSDGDGIPNVQDPDDDNAGVSDQDDPAPFDPTIEPTPVPGPLSPIHDDDGDGIPNIQDPDDDNDGVSDDEDPGEPDPVGNSPDSGTGVGGVTVPGGGGEAPVVTALPSTGNAAALIIGMDAFVTLALGAGVLLALALRLRTRRTA
jgi:hypothetical protein